MHIFLYCEINLENTSVGKLRFVLGLLAIGKLR